MTKQWTAEELLKTAWSFQSACLLTAAADMDLFSALHEGPLTADALADKITADLRATTILADALVAIELLTKEDAEYSLPPDVAELLCESSPNNVLPTVRHLNNCLRSWSRLAGVTRTGAPAERKPGIHGRAADQAAFIGAMHTISAPMAARVIDRLGPLDFNHLLDVGGASGTWTLRFLQVVPSARATIFDLPDVIPMARQRIADAGLTDRVTFAPGDFYQDDLPAGADFAWLGAITHQNSRRQNRELFAKVHTALEDKGSIVLRDVVMDPSHTSPLPGALFAVNMLVNTPKGGTYTFDEFAEDLTTAGFTDAALVHKHEFMESLIRAEKK